METTADPENPKLDICTVAASPFMRRIKKEKLKIYAITLYEINKALVSRLCRVRIEDRVMIDDEVMG